MKLDPHQFGLAGAIASAIFWTGCSILCVMFPAKSLELAADMMHLSSFGQLTEFFGVNAANYVSGLIQYAVYTYIYVYIFVYAYNRMNTGITSKK